MDFYLNHTLDFFSVSFTTVDGVTREFPVYAQPPSSIYRLDESRGIASPTYQAATTGPKDVVLLVDVSGSMCFGEFMSQNRILVDRIIKSTLHLGDFAAVLAVSNTVTRLGSQVSGDVDGPLDPVTADSKFDLRAPLCNQDCGGGSLLEPAFRVATDILQNSSKAGLSSGCDAHIVFVTDGSFQQRPIVLAQEFHKQAETFENNTHRKLHLHTYSFSPYINMTFQREFTCRHSGVMVDMSKNAAMNLTSPKLDVAWTTFAAAQRTAARQGTQGSGAAREITWSDIMYDTTLAQEMATVSMPVYSSLSSPRSKATDYLIGVVSVRVFMKDFGASLSLSDIPSFARYATTNMSLVTAYLAFHGMNSFGERCHKYTGSVSFEQSLRYEQLNYTCSAKEFVINVTDTDSLVQLSSEPVVDPSGTAVEHCPVVSLTGEKLFENVFLANFGTSAYRSMRCPNIPVNCKMYDAGRAQIRGDAEFNFALECVDSSGTIQHPLAWILALSLIIMLFIWTI